MKACKPVVLTTPILQFYSVIIESTCMFTGIIEAKGIVQQVFEDAGNLTFSVSSPISHELKIDQSVAHDGACLTVTQTKEGTHFVTAIFETLQKTNLRNWKPGYEVNLERCMKLGDRLDGHIVQGHVDQTAYCTRAIEENGSWRYWFEYDFTKGNITVTKGSVCVNGVSLTVVDSSDGLFSVAIIPYTYEHTNFHSLKAGDLVNIEFDILGKYIARLLQKRA